jgi:hypothetical protein
VTLTGPQQAKVGEKINVAVNVQDGAAVSSMTFVLRYDPAILKALAVNEGDLMRLTGAKSTFDADIDESGGKVVAVLATETGSASGGSIASILFEVIDAQRAAEVSVISIVASGATGGNVPIAAPQPLSVALQPKP